MTTSDAVRSTFRLWAPTAVSTFVLVAELPLIAAMVARAANGPAQLAGFGVVVSAIVIFNAASLALASVTVATAGRQAGERYLRAYSAWVGVATAVLVALSVVPWSGRSVYAVLLDLPVEAERAALPALAILAPSCVAVSLRRFFQGVLMRRAQTSPVMRAASARLVVSLVVTAAALVLTDLPGAGGGALGLSLGAITETSVLAVAVARRGGVTDGGTGAGRVLGVLRVHLPLALTTLITMAPQAAVLRVVSTAEDAALALVAWPVLVSAVNLLSTPTQEFEPITAAARDRPGGVRAALITTVLVASGASLAVVLLAATSAGRLYFTVLNDLPEDVAATGAVALWVACPLPFLFALRAHLRGVLVGGLRVAVVNGAGAVGLAVMIGLVAAFGGTALGGAIAGVLVLDVVMLTECVVLAAGVRSLRVREMAQDARA